MRRMARFVKDISGSTLVYPEGTQIEPLYEHEYGYGIGKPYEKRWFVRVYLYDRPMFCLGGVERNDFEHMDGKE